MIKAFKLAASFANPLEPVNRSVTSQSPHYFLTASTVLSLLTGMLVASCSGSRGNDAANTHRTIDGIMVACIAYKADCGVFPPEQPGLRALIDSPGTSAWQGPYLHGEIPGDAWGNAFKYSIVNGNPVIESAGPDGKFATPDDITGAKANR
ncbi:MAG: type II secretion system protein GspG [bacterium]